MLLCTLCTRLLGHLLTGKGVKLKYLREGEMRPGNDAITAI